MSSTPAGRDAPLRQTLSPLQPFLRRADVTEVVINQPGEIVVETHEGWQHVEETAITQRWLAEFTQLAATYNSQRCNEQTPILSGTLPGGERVQIVVPPSVEPGLTSITIRVPGQTRRTRADYEATDFTSELTDSSRESDRSLPRDDQELLSLKEQGRWWDFFIESVKLKKNIVISGKTGVGKTTYTNCLIDYIPTHERIITIEDTRELTLPHHRNKVHLLANPVVDAVALLKSCLRMKPDRILLAELRDSTALEFVSTASSGHPGTITTIHAGNVPQAFSRLARLIRQSPDVGTMTQPEIMGLLRSSVDVLIQMHVREEPVSGTNTIRKKRIISDVYFDPMAREGLR